MYFFFVVVVVVVYLIIYFTFFSASVPTSKIRKNNGIISEEIRNSIASLLSFC